MTSFLSLKLWAAIAPIQPARSRPERAFSSAKNCSSSWRSSAAIASPASCYSSKCRRARSPHSAIQERSRRRWPRLFRAQRPGADGNDPIRLGGNLDVVDLGPALGERTIERREGVARLPGGVHVKRAVEIGKIIDGAVARRVSIGKRVEA